MSRDLTPAVAAALADQDLRPVIFFEGEFPGGFVRVWTGYGTLQWGGKAWTGAGTLLGLGGIEETGEVVANGTTITLSGVPVDLVQIAIEEAQQGLPGRVWVGLLDDGYNVIADPVQAFSGRLDVPNIVDGADTCTVTISYESRLIDLTVPRTWRYTHESQQILHPGDLGFEYVTTIQDKEITWGRKS